MNGQIVMYASAATFFSDGVDILSTIVMGIGGFLLAQGIINLMQAYGDGSDARSKNQGWIQIAAGAGVILIGTLLVPNLVTLFPGI